MLVISKTLSLPSYRFNMYNTVHHQDRYCLLYSVHDGIVEYFNPEIFPHQIISYCFQPSEENGLILNSNYNNSHDPYYTFTQLREKGVSSELLLSWSASIDMAERYQIFLNNVSHPFLFYNCTLPWFGPSCRFTLDEIFNMVTKN
jgi:hypothetical protein